MRIEVYIDNLIAELDFINLKLSKLSTNSKPVNKERKLDKIAD